MNKNEALKWLVDNVTEWPGGSHRDYPESPSGWYWVVDPARLLGKTELVEITRKDWEGARQVVPMPVMMTRDEALQWLVENVTVWPVPNGSMPPPPNPEGWYWNINQVAPIDKAYTLKCHGRFYFIQRKDWEAARQPTRATVPEMQSSTVRDMTDQIRKESSLLVSDTLARYFMCHTDVAQAFITGRVYAMHTDESMQLFSGEELIIELFNPSFTYERGGKAEIVQNYRLGSWSVTNA